MPSHTDEERRKRAQEELARRELARRELARRGTSFDAVESGGSTTSRLESSGPMSSFAESVGPSPDPIRKIGQAAQHPEQFAAGVGEVLPIMAKNFAGVVPDALKPEVVERGEEAFGNLLEQRRQETLPNEPGEGLARMLGRGLGEGGAGVALGLTKPLQAAGAIGAQAAGKGEMFARVLPQIMGDIGVGSAIAVDPKEGVAQALPAAFPKSEGARQFAEGPGRFVAEVALAGFGNIVGEAAGPALKGAFRQAHRQGNRELAERALKSFVESQSEDSPAMAAWKAAADAEETVPLAPRNELPPVQSDPQDVTGLFRDVSEDPDWTPAPGERIRSAANINPDGSTVEAPVHALAERGVRFDRPEPKRGFTTTESNYISRKQAETLAEQTDQIDPSISPVEEGLHARRLRKGEPASAEPDLRAVGADVDPLVGFLREKIPHTEIAGYQKLDNGEWRTPDGQFITEQKFLETERSAIDARRTFEDYAERARKKVESLRAERDAKIDKIDMSDEAIRVADESASARLNRATGNVFYKFRTKESLKEWFRTLNKRFFDGSAIMNRAFKNSPTSASINPYYAVRNLSGAAAHGTWMRKIGVFRAGTMDLKSPSFDKALTHSGDVDKLEKYLTALRASSYDAVVGEDGVSRRAGLTKEEINAWMSYGKTKEIREAGDMLHDFNREILFQLEEEAVIPAGSAAKILSKPENFFYVPLQREVNAIKGRLGGFAGQPNPIKVRGEGRTASINSPLESMVGQIYTYAELMARSRLLRGIIADADRGPSEFVREISEIPDFSKAIEGASQSLKTLLPEAIVDEMDTSLRMGLTPYTTVDGRAILPIRDPASNQMRYFEVHKDIYEALTIMPPHHYSTFSKLAISLGRGLRTGVTIMPDFWMSNMYRDTIMASVVKGSLKDALRDLTAGMGIELQNVINRTYQAAGREAPFQEVQDMLARMGSSGGAMFELSGMDRAESRKVIEFLGQRNLEFSQKTRKVLHTISEVMQTPGRMSENAMRSGTYKNTYKKLRAEGMSEVDASARAAFEAREVTVDFARRGSALSAGNMDDVMAQRGEFIRLSNAFWNAGLQGTSRTVRLFADPKTRKRAFITSAAMITTPTVINYMHNRERDSYWNLPDWQRMFYTNVRIPGIDWFPDELVADPAKGFWGNVHKVFWREWNADTGTFDVYLRLPSAHELGLVFQTVPLAMMEAIDPRNPSRKGTGELLGGNLGAIFSQELRKYIPLPTAASVPLGVAMNKDFTGAHIVNPNVLSQNIDPSLKGQGSGLGTAVSERVTSRTGGRGPTPEQVDHLIQGFRGGQGKFITDMLEGIFHDEALFGPRPARKVAEQKAWQRFFTVGSQRGSQYIRDVYADLEKLERQENNANKLETAPGRQLQSIQTRLPEGQYLRLQGLRDLVKTLSDMRQDYFQHEGSDKDPEGNYYEPQSKRLTLDAISLQIGLLGRIGAADKGDRDRIRAQYGEELGNLEVAFLDAFDRADEQMVAEEAQTAADRRLFQGRDTKVVRTVDGDTAVLPDSTHVRFYNVLAQEVGTEVGDSLAAQVRELLQDQRVRVSIPGPSRDGYNRLLADLILPTGENVSDIVKKEQERLVREKKAREILSTGSLR